MKRVKVDLSVTEKNITGRRIRSERVKAGLSQKQLSEQLELIAVYICRGSVSRIESCERIVSDVEIRGIAEVLGVPIEVLFETEAREERE